MNEPNDMDPTDKEFLEALGKKQDDDKEEDSERLYNACEILSIRCSEYYSLLKDESGKQKHRMPSELVAELVLDYQNHVLHKLGEIPEDEDE